MAPELLPCNPVPPARNHIAMARISLLRPLWNDLLLMHSRLRHLLEGRVALALTQGSVSAGSIGLNAAVVVGSIGVSSSSDTSAFMSLSATGALNSSPPILDVSNFQSSVVGRLHLDARALGILNPFLEISN